MHPTNNPSPVQNATSLSHDETTCFYPPATKRMTKGTHHWLRTFSCFGIALSMLLTSAQLPVRQAEAFVSPVAKAFVHVVSSALVVDQLTSPQQPQEVQQYATEQCIQTFNSASFLSSTHREAIKKAWCGSTAVGGTLDQTGLLIQTVCNGQEKCLADLQKTMERLMKSFGKKFTVNVQSLCTVLITLFKQSIKEYCKANGYAVTKASTSSGSAGKPPNSGGGIKMNSGAKPPSPNFLAGLLSRVQSAIERMWNDCKNPIARWFNPKCKSASPNKKTEINGNRGNVSNPPSKSNVIVPFYYRPKTPVQKMIEGAIQQEIKQKKEELDAQSDMLVKKQITLIESIVNTIYENKDEFLKEKSFRDVHVIRLQYVLQKMLDMRDLITRSLTPRLRTVLENPRNKGLSQADVTAIFNAFENVVSETEDNSTIIDMLVTQNLIINPPDPSKPLKFSNEQRKLLDDLIKNKPSSVKKAIDEVLRKMERGK